MKNVLKLLITAIATLLIITGCGTTPKEETSATASAEATQASVKALIDFASNLVKVNARQDTPKDSAGFSAPEKNGSLSEMAKAARIIK